MKEMTLLAEIATTLPLIEAGETSEVRAEAAKRVRRLMRDVAYVRGVRVDVRSNVMWAPELTR